MNKPLKIISDLESIIAISSGITVGVGFTTLGLSDLPLLLYSAGCGYLAGALSYGLYVPEEDKVSQSIAQMISGCIGGALGAVVGINLACSAGFTLSDREIVPDGSLLAGAAIGGICGPAVAAGLCEFYLKNTAKFVKKFVASGVLASTLMFGGYLVRDTRENTASYSTSGSFLINTQRKE